MKVLNLAAALPRSRANGPGLRYVLWLQGCVHRCPGCFNPEFQELKPVRLVAVETLARRILAEPEIEGVTYTGGEPLLQVEALLELSRILRSEGLGIVCYTGYYIEELHNKNEDTITEFLQMVDLLIDGPFIREQQAPLLWRGSANQRLIFLSDRYKMFESQAKMPQQEISFVIGRDSVRCSGIWKKELLARIQKLLHDET